MAEQERVIRLKWENGQSFTLTSKLDEGDTITILSLDENSCLAKLWDAGIQQAIMAYLEHEVKKIGTEMKAP